MAHMQLINPGLTRIVMLLLLAVLVTGCEDSSQTNVQEKTIAPSTARTAPLPVAELAKILNTINKPNVTKPM